MHPYGVVALAVGGACAFGGLFFLIGWVRSRRARDWVRARGMVINRRTGLPSGFPSQYPTFEWYDAHGRRHQHTSSVRQSPAPFPGRQVDVLYDPANPSRAQMDTWAQSGRAFMVVGIVIASVAVLGGAFAAFVVSMVLEVRPTG
ncbi:DUF3592 domain-containing protein [Xylanimonas oleitrophica]|uniref:DUF3592 domain-containing protein n=1 Tax=Xylanimonas oleitrophica TaxID=2607479 RepID=UPI0015D01D69|nr:DUF3592 domain-containing protein [Xylanimonas oleitrophica]